MKANKADFYVLRGDLEEMFIKKVEVDNLFEIYKKLQKSYVEEKINREKDFKSFTS
jgi:hypothetical protein